MAAEDHPLEVAELVGHRFEGVHVLAERDALLERLHHFLVVQPVGRRVLQALAVGQRHAAPAANEGDEVGVVAGPGGARARGAHRAAVRQELVEDGELLGVEPAAHRRLAQVLHHRLVPVQRLLHLDRVIRHELGGRVDAREAAADHHGGQPHLQVGHRLALERAGQLQGHQEVAGLADAANEVALDVDDGGPARARGNGHVVEAVLPRLAERQRAAEADAAVDLQLLAARQREVDEREEVLVPPHGDAVLGDAAKALEHALVERAVDLLPLPDGAAHPLAGQRLHLQAVHGHHAEALVQQVVRQRVAGRAQAHHQHVLAVVRQRVRALHVERVPARQQAVDLHAPRQLEHVGEHARLDLRDVHRLLLLVDAPLHAVVADAVARARAHGVVDDHEGKGADGVAALAHRVHLGDLLVERAADQRDAQHVLRDGALLVANALRAGVPVALVAQHAVVHLAQHLGRGVARVGELEALAVPQRAGGPLDLLLHVGARAPDLHEIVVVEVLGEAEHHPALVAGVVHVRRAPALQRVDLNGERGLVGLAPAGAEHLVAIEQAAAEARDGQLLCLEGRGFSLGRRPGLKSRPSMGRHKLVIFRGGGHVRAALKQGQRAAAHEVDLEAKQVVVGARGRGHGLDVGAHAEQPGDEAAHVRRHRHDEVRPADGAQRLGHLAMLRPLREQVGVGRLEVVLEPVVQVLQPRGVVKISKGEPGNTERGRG